MPEQTSAAPAAAPQASPQDSSSQQASPQASSSELNASQQEQVENAIEEGASPQEVKSLIKNLKLVVNGKTIERKIDLMDEKALIRDYQLAESNKQGMSKARELEKLFEQELSRLKSDPWSVLQELGHDPYALAEGKLNEWVDEQKKSPEQVEFEKMQRELSQARDELKKREVREKEMREKQTLDQATREINSQIDDALSATKTLPNTPKTRSRIADALIWAMENGFSEAQVSDVIPLVERDIKEEMQSFISEIPEDFMESYLGQKNMEKLRKKRLAQVKKVGTASTVEMSKPVAQAPKKKISAREFFKDPTKY